MADDEFAALATGLNEDAKAARKRKPKAETAGDQAGAEASEAGSPDDEAHALGEVVENAVDDALDDEPATVGAVENVAEALEVDARTAKGDLRDFVLDLFKTRDKVWTRMSEDEQLKLARAIDKACASAVDKVVVAIAEGDGDGAVYGKLEQFTVKEGFKATLTGHASHEAVARLSDAVGANVVIRRADPKPFSGAKREVAIDPDQPGLTFADNVAEVDKGDPQPGNNPFDGDTDGDPVDPDADLAGEGG